LNSGQTIPAIGFGLWKILPGLIARKSVKSAIEAGYKHFDTAQVYRNEQHLGSALKNYGLERKDTFITTKIASNSVGANNQTRDKLIPSFEKSLKKLQTDYVDLLLMHFPRTETRQEAWAEMEKLYKDGRAKSIGVSNFMINHLEELLTKSKVIPAVNQVELHVYLQQPELLDFCKKQEIVVEAYSPLAHGYGIDNPVLDKLAKKYGKTNAQVMLRWCIETGTVPLPKSVHKDRIKENIEIFDFNLDTADMDELKKLDRGYRTCWDPTHVP
jgi:diketogulonate reductase-like aldo/keto reductase